MYYEYTTIQFPAFGIEINPGRVLTHQAGIGRRRRALLLRFLRFHKRF